MQPKIVIDLLIKDKKTEVNHGEIYTTAYAQQKGITPGRGAFIIESHSLKEILNAYIAFVRLEHTARVEPTHVDESTSFARITYPATRPGYLTARIEQFVALYGAVPASTPEAA